jgi:excisionase family DNA binding protein
MGDDQAPQASEPIDEIMDAGEVATFLRVDKKTIYAAAAKQQIPHRRLGKRFIFSRRAILDWLTGGLREPKR